MAYPARGLPSHIRSQSSLGGSQQQSPVLLARIAEKKAELASLKDLQDLSAGLADQMQTLAEKLTTLSNGTEAVAAVLSNWHNVLRAINMASSKYPPPLAGAILIRAGKLPKPKDVDDAENPEPEPPLPQTLVRIPTQHAPAVLPQPDD